MERPFRRVDGVHYCDYVGLHLEKYGPATAGSTGAVHGPYVAHRNYCINDGLHGRDSGLVRGFVKVYRNVFITTFRRRDNTEDTALT